MLCLLAVYRCVMVIYPEHSPKLNSCSGATALLLGSWVYTAIIVAPACFGWGSFGPECIGIK
jgi:hypothetical protein